MHLVSHRQLLAAIRKKDIVLARRIRLPIARPARPHAWQSPAHTQQQQKRNSRQGKRKRSAQPDGKAHHDRQLVARRVSGGHVLRRCRSPGTVEQGPGAGLRRADRGLLVVRVEDVLRPHLREVGRRVPTQLCRAGADFVPAHQHAPRPLLPGRRRVRRVLRRRLRVHVPAAGSRQQRQLR